SDLLASQLLEAEQREMKQLEGPGDALKKQLCGVLSGFVRRPGHAAHFGDGREAVVHFRDVAIRFPGVAPRPIDAEPAFPRGVRTWNLDLVVRARTGFRSHDPCFA